MGRWVSLCPCHNYLKEAALTSICRAKNKLFKKKITGGLISVVKWKALG